MNGSVSQKDNKFYLKVKGAGEFEMGLVSEGYRKLSTMTYLILSGSLNKNAILFWDEPETNMNPKLISHVTEALIKLSHDRVRCMNVEPDFPIWKEYAKKEHMHPAILSYLELHPSHFYRAEADVDGLKFVTARGWEDLSHLMKIYEKLDIPVDENTVSEFVRHGLNGEAQVERVNVRMVGKV